jgi:hypothetical protein
MTKQESLLEMIGHNQALKDIYWSLNPEYIQTDLRNQQPDFLKGYSAGLKEAGAVITKHKLKKVI